MSASVASIGKASGKAYCRGRCGWNNKIPEGAKCLRVSVRGESNYYCEVCMKSVLDDFAQAINDAEKDVSEL